MAIIRPLTTLSILLFLTIEIFPSTYFTNRFSYYTLDNHYQIFSDQSSSTIGEFPFSFKPFGNRNRFYLDSLDFSSSQPLINFDLSIGNEVKDPGPYVDGDKSSENVDKLGHQYYGSINYNNNHLYFQDQRYFYTDRKTTTRGFYLRGTNSLHDGSLFGTYLYQGDKFSTMVAAGTYNNLEFFYPKLHEIYIESKFIDGGVKGNFGDLHYLTKLLASEVEGDEKKITTIEPSLNLKAELNSYTFHLYSQFTHTDSSISSRYRYLSRFGVEKELSIFKLGGEIKFRGVKPYYHGKGSIKLSTLNLTGSYDEYSVEDLNPFIGNSIYKPMMDYEISTKGLPKYQKFTLEGSDRIFNIVVETTLIYDRDIYRFENDIHYSNINKLPYSNDMKIYTNEGGRFITNLSYQKDFNSLDISFRLKGSYQLNMGHKNYIRLFGDRSRFTFNSEFRYTIDNRSTLLLNYRYEDRFSWYNFNEIKDLSSGFYNEDIKDFHILDLYIDRVYLKYFKTYLKIDNIFNTDHRRFPIGPVETMKFYIGVDIEI